MYNDPNNMNNNMNNNPNAMNNGYPNNGMQPMQQQPIPMMTSSNPNVMPNTAPVVNNVEPPKKKRGPIIPLIMCLLVLAVVGYTVYTYKDTLFNTGTEKTAKKESEKTTKDSTKDEKETKETTTSTEDNKEKTETAATTNDAPTQTNESSQDTPSVPDVEMIPGTILYLMEGGAIGMNEVMFRYVSETTNQIVVDVILREDEANKKTYTINLGEETTIKGLKNKIVIAIDTEHEDKYFAINFK